MTPLEVVNSRFTLPFQPYPFQCEVMNNLAPLERAGYYLDTGTGKTLTSTLSALYKMIREGRKAIVLMPPILVPMWYRWLKKIPTLKVLMYQGSPAKRKEFNFDDFDFVLMSIHIFKRDWDEIVERCKGSHWSLLIDEATSIKNVGSDNHKAMNAFINNVDSHLMLLTGTPLTTPVDGYAYIKMIAPGTYRNLNHFENTHVAARDFFKNVTQWRHLDMLAENMKINSARVLKTDVLKELPEVTVTPLYYALDDSHYRLYKKVATEQLLELESGGKVDATNVSALYHALGQLVVNWGYFEDDMSKVAAGIELAEELIRELDPDGKLVIFANYKLTNRLILEKMAQYNPVAVFGDITQAQQRKNVDRFVEDPTCRIFVGQPTSAGFGIDLLQTVCHDMLFLEPPQTPAQMEQAIARLHRGGQHDGVHARMAVAERTLQVKQLDALLAKEILVSRVVRSPDMLRGTLFGE